MQMIKSQKVTKESQNKTRKIEVKGKKNPHMEMGYTARRENSNGEDNGIRRVCQGGKRNFLVRNINPWTDLCFAYIGIFFTSLTMYNLIYIKSASGSPIF